MELFLDFTWFLVNGSKHHATKANSFEVAVFQQSFILCGTLYLCLSYSDRLLRKLIHYLMTSPPDWNMSHSNVFILTYIA